MVLSNTDDLTCHPKRDVSGLIRLGLKYKLLVLRNKRDTSSFEGNTLNLGATIRNRFCIEHVSGGLLPAGAAYRRSAGNPGRWVDMNPA
ncbi:hypothetical protein EVAR_47723_1 [Eumeta japonica]|uniref:Uncharacterized protein n=1 Tax=Eumeta variegata TaxID=151549 RepID=A0A4C1VV56_EUMVA|nr:hypothetical protein EVAR_47723_1 [Eumeta japonica]